MAVAPVLLIIFNHPETTQQVFNAIRAAKPAQLFVSADGPRPDKAGEKARCEQARAIINQVDWECKVSTHYSDINLGVVPAILGGISWFFEQVEEGIILEGDCLPHADFWMYATELLARYRHTDIVKVIGGNNFQRGIERGNASYYFSAYPHIWGWATWRRAWKEVQYDITQQFTRQELGDIARWISDKKDAQAYWLRIFRYVWEDRPNMWDYRLALAGWKSRGLSIIPQKNLVTNIGFHAEALTTKDANSPFANLPLNPILPLTHPDTIERNGDADDYYYENYLKNTLPQGLKSKVEDTLPWGFKKQLKAIVHKLTGK